MQNFGSLFLRVSTDYFLRSKNLFKLTQLSKSFSKRYFSTGNWYVVTSGKLFEKRQRKIELRKRKALEKANQKASSRKKLTKKEAATIHGNPSLYFKFAPLKYPSFHNIERNRFGRIVEPTCRFRLVISTSKNNVWIVAQAIRSQPGEEGNLSEHIRTLFKTSAGNVGIRKAEQQTATSAFHIGESFGKKCKRFGIISADVVFRQSMRIPAVLRGLTLNVGIKSLIHMPRLPKCKPPRSKKRRRV